MTLPVISSIVEHLRTGKSVALIGPTDSGKTYAVVHELVPTLTEAGKRVAFLTSADKPIEDALSADIIIIDEMETLLDRQQLERAHPDEEPYYNPEHLERVSGWFQKCADITKPLLLIITRNAQPEVDQLVQLYTKTGWGKPITAIVWRQNH